MPEKTIKSKKRPASKTAGGPKRVRTSEETLHKRARTTAQNGILMAQYYRELSKWKYKGSDPRTMPEPPSAMRLPTGKQVAYLNHLLGGCSYPSMIRFVEFANDIVDGYYPRWAEKGTTLLNRVCWIEAITLAKTGRNNFGTAEELVIASFIT